MQAIPYPYRYDIDVEGEVMEERRQQAMRKIQVAAVLMTLDDLISSEQDHASYVRQHPATGIVEYYLARGGTDTGTRPHNLALAAEQLDALVKRAIDSVLEAYLHNDALWED